MKKVLALTFGIVLIAAACNKQAAVSLTPAPAPNPADQASVYETGYMKVSIPAGWKATAAGKNSSAVNIAKGNYILYINTQAGQASGVEGGRFAEIAMGAPSAEAVVTEWPNNCGKEEVQAAYTDHSRVDLYVNKADKQPGCAAPANGSTVWYFSYINGKDKAYFNYYSKIGPTGVVGYVITMSYQAKDVNKLPVKGNAELNTMLSEMTSIAKSLEIRLK